MIMGQIETWELGQVIGAVTALSQALNHSEALERPQENREKLQGTQP